MSRRMHGGHRGARVSVEPRNVLRCRAGGERRESPSGSRGRTRFDGRRTAVLSVTTDSESVSGDEAPSPFRNVRCADGRSMWWLPHRTMPRDHAVRSSGTSSNVRKEAPSVWNRTILPAGPASAVSLHTMLPSATLPMANALAKGTRKIGAHRKNPAFPTELIRRRRHACNLAVVCFREARKGLAGRQGPESQANRPAAMANWYRFSTAARRLTFR